MVEDITEKRTAKENLQRSEANLQHLAGRLIHVQEEERPRIGRELHDGIGQRRSLLVVGLEGIRDSLPGGQNSQSQVASELHRKAVELATDIQNLSRDLLPSSPHVPRTQELHSDPGWPALPLCGT
jgi:signal transduction histidine kinase